MEYYDLPFEVDESKIKFYRKAYSISLNRSEKRMTVIFNSGMYFLLWMPAMIAEALIDFWKDRPKWFFCTWPVTFFGSIFVVLNAVWICGVAMFFMLPFPCSWRVVTINIEGWNMEIRNEYRGGGKTTFGISNYCTMVVSDVSVERVVVVEDEEEWEYFDLVFKGPRTQVRGKSLSEVSDEYRYPFDTKNHNAYFIHKVFIAYANWRRVANTPQDPELYKT